MLGRLSCCPVRGYEVRGDWQYDESNRQEVDGAKRPSSWGVAKRSPRRPCSPWDKSVGRIRKKKKRTPSPPPAHASGSTRRPACTVLGMMERERRNGGVSSSEYGKSVGRWQRGRKGWRSLLGVPPPPCRRRPCPRLCNKALTTLMDITYYSFISPRD